MLNSSGEHFTWYYLGKCTVLSQFEKDNLRNLKDHVAHRIQPYNELQAWEIFPPNGSTNCLLYLAFYLVSWTHKHHHSHLCLSIKRFRIRGEKQAVLRHSPDGFPEISRNEARRKNKEENLDILYTLCGSLSLNYKPQNKDRTII